MWSAGAAKSTIPKVLFLLTLISSGRLAEMRWSVSISKSQRSLCVSFSMTDSGLRIYLLLILSNFNFLHNSQWITYICYLVVSYLFLLWCNCFLWRCFVQELKEIIIIIIILLFWNFFPPRLADGFSQKFVWQVSRTLLGILADLNNAVVRMVSTCPLISKSSNSFINHLRIVLSASIAIGITVNFMFHCLLFSGKV